MLALLVWQTSAQGGSAALLDAVGRQRALANRVAMIAVGMERSPEPARAAWRQRLAIAVGDWQEASTRLNGTARVAPALPADLARGSEAAEARAVQAAMISLAERLASGAGSAATVDTMTALSRRYVLVSDDLLGSLEVRAERGVDGLVQLEAICVVLLLAVIGFSVRLALAPAQERLAETVSALEESEARTRAMLDAMDEGMLLTDAEGQLLAANPSAQRALGLASVGPHRLADIVGRLCDEQGNAVPLDQLPSRETLRTGLPRRGVVLGVREEGGLARWLSANTHPLFRDGADRAHAVVTVFRDVSDARQLEEERASQAEALELQNQELFAQAEALERGHALFRSLVDTAGSAIVGLDLEGRVFEWNREAEALFGVTRAEALGRDYAQEFVPDGHRDRMRGEIRAVLGGDERRNHTGPVRNLTGARRTVIWNITPLRAAVDGRVHGLIAAGIDITDREASDERFRVLFERSSDAHLLLDDTGVLDCNDATLRLLQYDSKGAVLGRGMADISPRRQPDGRLSLVVGAQMRQTARDRGYHRFEWVHRRADGRDFPVEVTLTPVRLDGREVILSVWHDIAERKAVESALRAAKDAAESANRTKSEFMTRMNHELRTPLTAIIGFSRVLLQGKQGELSEGAQRYADRIRANGMHLLSLINQILDVAKVEAGRMDLEPERIGVDDVVRDTVQMLEATAEVKGIALRTELPDRLTLVVTDAAKLRQILINLVGNAVKFTDAGEVCVRVEADPISARPVAIIVRDTGIGIPPDRQQKVFEPFEQGESSTRRQFGGTGLGLSIVKAFAELIGAAIEVESAVGEGTTFTIWLAPTDLELPAEGGALAADG